MKRPIINEQMISIPPYIATTWKNVAAVYKDTDTLCFKLLDGTEVRIKDLSDDVIEEIFSVHAASVASKAQSKELDKEEKKPAQTKHTHKISSEIPFSFLMGQTPEQAAALQFGGGSAMGMGAMMQHNPEQSDAPLIPDEVLSKITGIARVLAPEELEAVPPSHAGCNCMFCQISRAIHGGDEESLEDHSHDEEMEDISDDDLHFGEHEVDERSEWRIEEVGEKIFKVSSIKNPDEQYQVFLGDPIGCTCGETGCAHVRAVLIS